ncbi:MAG: class I SAM-dependent methyltransferase [Desulfosporosinus sp.]|nr:class I SAM-dependent methyltransferase [Desulfosporosinus sp.]
MEVILLSTTSDNKNEFFSESKFDAIKNIFINVIELSKMICKLKLNNGDRAVDCTMGNGNDTELLCRLVGNEGKVYAFDIQEEAVINTSKKLQAFNFLERAEIILDGHQNIDNYIQEKVRLVIFNLGYLPKGNHQITTKKETTLEAVQKCLNILEPNGIILLIIYPGHENGKIEKEALENFTSGLNQKKYNVAKLCFTNQINNPPELICIEKVCPK